MEKEMAFDPETYFEENEKDFVKFWDDVHSGRMDGKIGVIEDGTQWFVLTGKTITYDQMYGPPIDEKSKYVDKLEM